MVRSRANKKRIQKQQRAEDYHTKNCELRTFGNYDAPTELHPHAFSNPNKESSAHPNYGNSESSAFPNAEQLPLDTTTKRRRGKKNKRKKDTARDEDPTAAHHEQTASTNSKPAFSPDYYYFISARDRETESDHAAAEANELRGINESQDNTEDSIGNDCRGDYYIAIDTPDDGHCLLNAVVGGYNNQLRPEEELTKQTLIDKIVAQTVDNYHEYLEYTVCSTDEDIWGQLDSYLYNYDYDLPLVDAMPLIICNSLNVSLSIRDTKEDIRLRQIRPSKINPECSNIVLLKDGDHYLQMNKVEKRPYMCA